MVAVNEAKLTCVSTLKVGQSKLEETSAGADLIEGLQVILTRWVEAAHTIPDEDQKQTHLYSLKVPKISIKQYLKRISNFFACSEECYVMALVYIDRITNSKCGVTVCNRSAHRLLLVAMMLAAKIQDDFSYSSTYYARVGGMSVEELNVMEIEFLKLLNWRTFVDPMEHQLYDRLVRQSSGRPLQMCPTEEPEPEPVPRREN